MLIFSVLSEILAELKAHIWNRGDYLITRQAVYAIDMSRLRYHETTFVNTFVAN